MATIYAPLLDEGVDVWRPVKAHSEGRDGARRRLACSRAGRPRGRHRPERDGKSTLLRVPARLEPVDTGCVQGTPPGLAVAYVAPGTECPPAWTLLAYRGRQTGVAAAEAEVVSLAGRLAEEPDAADAYDRALAMFLALGGGDLETRAATLLSWVDVLLLDEPTNDLDFDGLERLERFLGAFQGGVVCVSHDRAFLARTVTRVLELEAETRRPRLPARTGDAVVRPAS